MGLGPEQLVVVATGEYADPAYDLGRDETIRIPADQGKITLKFAQKAKNTILSETLDMRALPGKDLRIFLQQFGADGLPVRSWGGAHPNGQKMDALLSIRVLQAGKEHLLYNEYGKMILRAQAWPAVELLPGDLEPGVALAIRCPPAQQRRERLE